MTTNSTKERPWWRQVDGEPNWARAPWLSLPWVPPLAPGILSAVFGTVFAHGLLAHDGGWIVSFVVGLAVGACMFLVGLFGRIVKEKHRS